MLEKDLKRKVMNMIKKDFAEVWCYKASDKWQSGIPDIIGCLKGVFFGIELKRPGARPRPLQVYVMEQIRRSGGYSLCADSVDQVRNFLNHIRQGGDDE